MLGLRRDGRLVNGGSRWALRLLDGSFLLLLLRLLLSGGLLLRRVGGRRLIRRNL